MTEAIANEIKNYLLTFQDDYSTGEPNSIINSPELTLIYKTARPQEMYTAIVNSTALRARLNQRNVTLQQLLFTDRSVIIECSLSNGQ